jgi:hypothetical protein
METEGYIKMKLTMPYEYLTTPKHFCLQNLHCYGNVSQGRNVVVDIETLMKTVMKLGICHCDSEATP